MIKGTDVDYRLSLNILEALMSKKFITQEEFNAIDAENIKSFKGLEFERLA